jgi:hypothetical protein
LKSYADLPKGDEKALLVAAARQPISVGIDAGRPSFMFYHSGVYNEARLSPSLLLSSPLSMDRNSLPHC